jgi:plastocyanin
VIQNRRCRKSNPALIACALLLLQAAALAQSVSGTILIKKRLTKPSVTASVPVYQRGPSVQLGQDSEEDPLAFERSRVVVYLEPAVSMPGSSATPAQVEVRQLDRRFVPDLVVVPDGSTVSFPNMDPIFHNIYSLSKAKAFDLGSYDKGQTRKVVFSKPGIVDVYCHLHPNMAATVVVTPNRWYARPDRSGHYEIPGVPPGRYTVVAWHKSAGFFRKTITLGDGKDGSADFFIPVDEDPKEHRRAAGSEAEAGSR